MRNWVLGARALKRTWSRVTGRLDAAVCTKLCADSDVVSLVCTLLAAREIGGEGEKLFIEKEKAERLANMRSSTRYSLEGEWGKCSRDYLKEE